MRIRRHAAVADGIAEQIRTGALPAGTRLPTHRALAARHGIAVATASRVYRDLTASGLVVGEPGRGTFVRDLSGFAGLEPTGLPSASAPPIFPSTNRCRPGRTTSCARPCAVWQPRAT